jgi:hypothetical protein
VNVKSLLLLGIFSAIKTAQPCELSNISNKNDDFFIKDKVICDNKIVSNKLRFINNNDDYNENCNKRILAEHPQDKNNLRFRVEWK